MTRYGGRVVVYGGTLGDAKIRPYSVFWRQLDILGSSMGSPKDFAEMLAMFDPSTSSGRAIKPAIDKVYPMSEVAAAAESVDKGAQFGKVLLAIS